MTNIDTTKNGWFTEYMKTQPKLDLVGMTEIAGMAGVNHRTIRAWRIRGKLPEPAALIAMGPVWLRSDIEAWLAGRTT